jgi:hypothetical protein
MRAVDDFPQTQDAWVAFALGDETHERGFPMVRPQE